MRYSDQASSWEETDRTDCEEETKTDWAAWRWSGYLSYLKIHSLFCWAMCRLCNVLQASDFGELPFMMDGLQWYSCHWVISVPASKLSPIFVSVITIQFIDAPLDFDGICTLVCHGYQPGVSRCVYVVSHQEKSVSLLYCYHNAEVTSTKW